MNWARNKHLRRELLFASPLVLCFVILLWPGLSCGLVPGFRDTYHFYYPQLVWLDTQAAQGHYFPAWNRLDGIGISTPGQGTSALYYPLRLVYLLPLPLPSRLALFSLLHLVLAALGIRLAGSRLGLSRASGWLAASSFSLSCPVFFQHSNLIYLCSAAWLGFAAAGLQSILSPHVQRHRMFGPIVLGLSTAMMVLAGDPHTAANCFILTAVCVLSKTITLLRQRNEAPFASLASAATKTFAALALCCVVTFVQWVPLLRAAQNSRVTNGSVVATHHGAYDFSLSPWHAFTCVFPKLGGSFTPENSRLFEVIPAEGRMWIPSLYFGCTPLFGLLLIRRQPNAKHLKPILFVAGFCLLAAFGSYSVIWVLRESLRTVGAHELTMSLPADPVASVYWLLSQCVPGYALFRYPAKWTVLFATAASLAAGAAWNDTLNVTHSKALVRRGLATSISIACVLVLAVSGAAFVASYTGWIMADSVDAWFAQRHSDRWLGHTSVQSVACTLLLSGCVPLCTLWTMLVLLRRRGSTVFVMLTMAELTFVGMHWITFVEPPRPPTEHIENQSDSAFVWVDVSQASIARDYALGPSATIAKTMCDYQDTMLLGKIANTANLRCLSTSLTLPPRPLLRISGHLSRLDNLSDTQPRLDKALAEIGVTHRLARRTVEDHTVFVWQSVEGARPLCNLVRHDEPENIQWTWDRCDSLSVQLQTDQDDLLVVRQYSDGGWRATVARGESSEESRLYPTIETTELGFIQLRIPAGKWKVTLSRKLLW